jgi:DNA-binding response OmpR family regulator
VTEERFQVEWVTELSRGIEWLRDGGAGVAVLDLNLPQRRIRAVADTLESELDVVIQEWLARVDKEPELTAVPLNFRERTGHLPQLPAFPK